MSKILIIPDVHLSFDKLHSILVNQRDKVDKIVYLGDFFDSFASNQIMLTDYACRYLLENILTDEKSVILASNHDVPVWFPNCPDWMKSFGWTEEKQELYNKYKLASYSGKIKFYHYEEGFVFSHAGLHKDIFCDYTGEFSEDRLEKLCTEARIFLESGQTHPVTRGGSRLAIWDKVGGLLWLDWNDEFEAIPNINQIVGHTPDYYPVPRIKIGENSINYCLDCGLTHYFILEYNILNVYKTYNHEYVPAN